MIDLPILTWLARPIIWLVRFAWPKLRIKDGSSVSIRCVGDTDENKPEFLYLGLKGVDGASIVRLGVAVKNEGRAPVRNLSVRVELPRNLTADVKLKSANPSGSDTFFSTTMGRKSIVLNFETSLRIDEGALFPILLRIRPGDWIDVKARGPQERKGDVIFTDYSSATPIRVAAFQMKVSAQADNIRGTSREWDVWLTPAEDWTDLENRSSALAAIQRIWSVGSKAFLFPFWRSVVFMPSVRGSYQPGVLIHLSSEAHAVGSEAARFFDVSDGNGFTPLKIYRSLGANPGEEGLVFRDWVRGVRKEKPDHYG